ncbi:hypothetical protein LEP1GSC047_4054 [Leptospira inadai serovar Lyme str. 10]|uniref:Band 7 domain-containing protein n=2 Tax=Leptospira inadai serovar Lyme TaxID=293084 RepID=V6HWB8_9LEPT|nr:hypothetical protein [Leptospira inadai]EQA37229.1 hypothetical protein LEP1GSC047_4054 [Leptospira inadai serovar Lyme str. 10]PNV73372.1 hypothetical protein BES34_017300 [Leptospira inadai serovar Lyme]
MIRWIGRAFLFLLLGGILVGIVYPIYIIGDGEVLVSWSSDSRVSSFIRGPGFAYEPRVYLFWDHKVLKEELRSLSEEVQISYDLSSGLFPKDSEEGRILARFEVVFSLEGEGSKKWFSAGGISESSRKKFLSGIFLSLLRSRIEDEKNLNLTKDGLSNFLRKEASIGVSNQLPWLRVESVRIVELQVPDPLVINNLLRNPNYLLAKKQEKLDALKKAELLLVQEEAKLSAAKNRWEAYRDFLKKNPEMKEFVLYESLGDKVEVILLPVDSILGDPKALGKKKQTARKPKEVE